MEDEQPKGYGCMAVYAGYVRKRHRKNRYMVGGTAGAVYGIVRRSNQKRT